MGKIMGKCFICFNDVYINTTPIPHTGNGKETSDGNLICDDCIEERKNRLLAVV